MKLTKLSFFFFTAIFHLLCSTVYASNDKINAKEWIAKTKTLSFQENKGQMKDMDGKPVPFVLFKAETPDFNIWLTDKGLTYQFIKLTESESSYAVASNKFSATEKVTEGGPSFAKATEGEEWHRVDMILKDAQIKKENIVVEGEINKGNTFYYYAHCANGIVNAKSYSKITIKNIYQGIDWVLYTNNGLAGSSLKQDFIVHPNANPNQLKLIYEGSGRIDFSNNQIHFENQIGEMTEGKLFCYQGNESNEVGSKYIVKKNQESRIKNQDPSSDLFSYEIQVQLNNYNKSQSLIIDPQLVWASFFGGNTLDGPMSVDTDIAGNVFVTGYVSSTDFPVSNAGTFYQGSNGGGSSDIFVSKFDIAGALQWSTYYGGTGNDQANSIKTDNNGNVFITGYTASTDLPLLNAGTFFQGTFGGAGGMGAFGRDAFMLKFSNTGARLWATYYGGSSGSEGGNSLDVDANGNVFVTGWTGYTAAADFPVQNAGTFFQAALAGPYDNVFILKFDNLGNRLWATFYGGNDAGQVGCSITTDPIGNIFVTGYTGATTFPVQNAGTFYQGALGNGAFTNDAFILKFDNLGNRQWATFYGGSATDYGYTIECDANGNVFLLGSTASPNFPTLTAGTFFQGAFGGVSDAFILKFDNLGNRNWATYYGGTAADYTTTYTTYDNIAIDDCGNVYVSFETASSNMTTKSPCDVGGYFDNTPQINLSYTDLFLAQFSNTGILNWATYYGGTGRDVRIQLAVDVTGNLFVSGEWTQVSSAATYPLTNPGGGAHYDATFNGGGDDGFIAKFRVVPATITSTVVSPVPCGPCNGSITVNVSGGCAPYNYEWSNGKITPATAATTDSISSLCGGAYWVIVNNDACLANSDTLFFTLTGGGNSVNTSQSPVICNGGSFTLPDGVVTSTPGTYIDTVLSSNGCDSIITTILSVGTAINTNQSPVICNGNSFTLPDGTIVSSAGTYVDTVLSSSGCDSIITTVLTVTSAFTTNQNPVLCTGSSFVLPGGNSVSVAGTYIDTVTTTSGCDSIITTVLTLKPNAAGSQSPTICSNTSYTLPGGAVVNASGTYYDTLLSFNGCDSIVTTTLTVNPSPVVGVSPDITISSGATATLTATGGGTYNWAPSAGLNTTTGNTVDATPSQTTTYCVIVTDANGCVDTACVTVTVETPCANTDDLGVPNAFSPNSDGANDEFCLQGWDACIEEFSVLIYNRWGEKVFESVDPNFCWDGISNGKVFDAQVFVYYIKAKYSTSDKTISQKGNISLIR